jgi:transcriptional regulator with XRE-family HTH domain
MGNLDAPDLALSEWLETTIKNLGWTQRRLAEMARTTPTTISELISGKQGLTAEMAEKLAVVPELKTTKEDLLSRAGVWAEARPSRRRDVAQALFDQLTGNAQDLAIDFMVMLAQRERETGRGK